MKKYIFLILIISGLILPVVSFAGDFSGPLVPCGTSANPNACTLCDLFTMIQTIIDFISAGIFVLAVIFITVGGLMILLAGANPGNLDLGKKMITNAIIGVIISLLAWTVINMVFNTLVGDNKNFPAPWNKIECKGGGVVEATNLTFCHIQYRDQNDVMFKKYDNNTLCSQGCGQRCTELGTACEDWCCLDKDRSGKDNVCSAVSENQWCKRTALPTGSENWKLTSYIQNPTGQKGDASTELTNFLNCMYGKISSLEINAISSNVICTNPTCDPTKESCGHGINSCHFGGTKCSGFSYAVDFNTNVSCGNIADAALGCNSGAWILWEGNHTHVSLSGRACGCAETQTEKIQCSGH